MNAAVEVFTVELAAAAAVPILGGVIRQYERIVFTKSEKRSICVWGGVAANALLMISGHTLRNYCFHDIEMFDTEDDKLAVNRDVLTSMQACLRKEKISLELGGLSIATALRGQSVYSFQMQRISLADGDLELNNILMEWIPGRREVAFYAPAGTVSSLAKPTLPIRAKPSVALQSSERIARRVYRNVSKAIRLDLACARVFDDGFMGHMNDLVSRYINRVTLELSSGHPPEWLTKAGIHSPQLAIEWLFSKSVSELSKRAVRLLHPGEIICEDLYSRMLTGESGLLRHRFLKPLVSHFDAVDVERRISTDAIITYLMDLEAYENQGSYSEWQLLDAKSPLPVFRPTVFGSK